jgi:hypothetical protein
MGIFIRTTAVKLLLEPQLKTVCFNLLSIFLAGFFGLGWTQNATLKVTIEQPGYNSSLATTTP